MNKSILLPQSVGNPKRLNRRSDVNVRSAIDAIQKLLFDPQASSRVFPLVLRHIADISHSDYGVIFTGSENDIGPIIRGKSQKLYPIQNHENTAFVCPKKISYWVEQNILPRQAVFFNDPIPKSHAGLLLYPEKIKALMMLPIISHNQLRGICIMAKKEGKYGGESIQRLMPLLGSVVCALQSADTVKSNLLNLEQKISDDRFLNSLLSTSLLAMLVVDDDQNIVVSNPAACEMFCSPPHEEGKLNGLSIYELIPGFNELFQWSKQPSRYGSKQTLKPRIWEDQSAYRLDSTQFVTNISAFRYSLGPQRYTALQIQDITALHKSAEEYQKTSQQLNALTHLVPVGIVRVDINWNCVFANDKWYEFSGQSHEESLHSGWVNAIHSDDVNTLLENLREALQSGNAFHAEFRLVTPLGQVRWVDFNAQVLFDENGTIQGFLATVADITERLLHQEKLRQVAEYDALTGLANRHLFQDRLKQAFLMSERDGQEVVVFFLDLDGFKDINDSLGHSAGDKLLQGVANRLLNVLRRSDTVARFGGDEFVVLLSSGEGDNDIPSVATKLIEAAATPYLIEEQEVYATISVGIALGDSANSSPEKILKQADAALYLAKNEGKNNFQLFNSNLDKEAKERVRLINQLRLALQNNRFFLTYQPQARVDNNEIIGFEALLRFKDEDGAIIRPDQFIPILEETSMIIDVGKWVIEESCRQLQLWIHGQQFPKGGLFSINVSPKQLLDKSFISTLLNACNKYQINPQQLMVEITETVIIDKPQKVQDAMMALKDIGVKLALDDFGTGYSSLSYLQRFPFDHLKIDKSFISDLLTDKNDEKITIAIIALAQSLGLKITAEGVVDNESLEILRKYGADYFQGYLLGEPQVPSVTVTKSNTDSPSLASSSSIPSSNIVDIRSKSRETC